MIDLDLRGPQTPQGNIPALTGKLPHFIAQGATRTLWLVAAHGGAGVTTLSQLDDSFRDAHRCWPQAHWMYDAGTACVVVARTSATGLRAAQGALANWADGGAGGARLLGLVLVDDAPGRLPKPLADLARVVAGGAPRTWRIGWNHAWRCGEPVTPDAPMTPAAVRRLVSELRALVAEPPADEDLAATTATQDGK